MKTQIIFGILVGFLGISIIDDYTQSFTQFNWINIWGVIKTLAVIFIAALRGYQMHKYNEVKDINI